MTRGCRWILALPALIVFGAYGDAKAQRKASPPPTEDARNATPREDAGRSTFAYSGSMVQGGVVIGIAPARATVLTFNGVAIPIAADGRFVIGFDRDSADAAELVATLDDGRRVRDTLPVARRHWNISRLDSLPKTPLPQPEFDRLRPAELAQIAGARRMDTDAGGWRQPFRWPATGRISTLFGSQRIYKNGEAGSYHGGLDIAVPQGTPVLSPADGVVILTADHPFTLEGNLLMVDHGMGLNSAFLHLSRIAVHVGQHVSRGETIGWSGMTGRATGPHLHWSLQWRGAKLDPLLATGPMVGGE
ncbi:MAG: M23 family metallopeptidase [Sphingomonas sp.]